jgi:hypothetical protein
MRLRIAHALPLVSAVLAAPTACGGLDSDSQPVDADVLDVASADAHMDAVFPDSSLADIGTFPEGASETSTNDASEASDSTAEVSTGEAGAEAGKHPSCNDQCELGAKQCLQPLVCTYDDAGLRSCMTEAEGIWTCAVADAGCTAWSRALACRPDVPCCVACQPANCPLGAVGNPCEQDTDCASNACDALTHDCVSNHCADHRQDGLESDIDCGGGCNACRGGQRCQSSGDCEPGQLCLISRVCSGAPIDASTTDAAGGPCNDECTLGNQTCSLLPQVCTYDDAGFTVSCEAPGEGTWSCVRGAAGCTVWAPGVACGSTCCAGCQEVPCDAGASSLCWVCPPASNGNPCEEDSDCTSAACDGVTHQCISDQCADHRQDGQESDVDCGGAYCVKCQVSQRCQGNQDCQPGHICNTGHVCQ